MKCDICGKEHDGYFFLLKTGKYSGHNVCPRCAKKILEGEEP